MRYVRSKFAILENVIKDIPSLADILDLETVDSRKLANMNIENSNELFEIIDNLKKDKMVLAEKINGLEKDKNVQAEKISLLHSRLSYLEKEYVFFLKKHTNENEQEIPNNQDTIVSDDQEQKINKAALVTSKY